METKVYTSKTHWNTENACVNAHLKSELDLSNDINYVFKWMTLQEETKKFLNCQILCFVLFFTKNESKFDKTEMQKEFTWKNLSFFSS